MLLNNAVSAAVGFVPLVGDIVLAAYKSPMHVHGETSKVDGGVSIRI